MFFYFSLTRLKFYFIFIKRKLLSDLTKNNFIKPKFAHFFQIPKFVGEK